MRLWLFVGVVVSDYYEVCLSKCDTLGFFYPAS